MIDPLSRELMHWRMPVHVFENRRGVLGVAGTGLTTEHERPEEG